MMNLRGVGVRCLVTSQDKDLCRGLSLSHPAIQIQIEDVKHDVALQILASHVGFTDKHIPAHLQGEAHKMLEGTQGNPLALASVATGIDYDRSNELVIWEAASQNFLNLLHSTNTAYTLGVPYSKSFRSATQLSIQSLKEGAQNLLILLHMCEAPSVPEEVLHILYCNAVSHGVSETFRESAKELESRGLVQISSQSLEYDTHRKQYSWTLHSLQKMFLALETSDKKETVLKVRKETMLKTLTSQSDGTNIEVTREKVETKSPRDISAEEDTMVQLSLCSLYFHEQYLKSALMMETQPNQLNSVKRNAIEQITRLLALPVSERWTKAAQGSAKQIYLTYIYNSALHDSGILDLLALPISVLLMLQALEDIAIVESETTLIDENSGALMKALLDFLRNLSDGGDTNIAMAAARVLVVLSGSKLHSGVIISSGILPSIVKIMLSDSHPGLRVASTHILANLAYDNEESRSQILQHPRIIEELIQSMSSNKIPALKIGATYAVVNLTVSNNDITRRQLMNFPGFLEQLLNLLSKENSPYVQESAAMALANLADSKFPDVKQKIVKHSRALSLLLASMSSNGSAKLQLNAAAALVNLTASDDITKRQLVNSPGLLEQLVNLLSKETSPDIQVSAVMALANLANSKFLDVKQKIVDYSNALSRLLASSSGNDGPKLQLEAARALRNLTTSDDITMRQLVNFPGLLEQLVNLLSKENNPDLQKQAAMALRNLAHGDMIQKIVNCSSALEQLLATTARNVSPELLLVAAVALKRLTLSNNDTTMRQLVNFPGLLEQLVNLLSEDHDEVDLRGPAAMSLRNLAKSQVHETRLRMMHCSGLLDKFFNSLSDGQFCEKSGWAYYVEAVTLIDPARGNGARLHSALAYSQRGRANLMLELNEDALNDLNRANEIEPGNRSILGPRCTVRARLGDFEGALVDSNFLIEKQRTVFRLQESGVLKRMMGDLPGALADLNESWERDPHDYEILKQRGFVRFLMNDDNGARFDAQMALKLKPSRVDASSYGHFCLGTTSVEFLDYKLR